MDNDVWHPEILKTSLLLHFTELWSSPWCSPGWCWSRRCPSPRCCWLTSGSLSTLTCSSDGLWRSGGGRRGIKNTSRIFLFYRFVIINFTYFRDRKFKRYCQRWRGWNNRSIFLTLHQTTYRRAGRPSCSPSGGRRPERWPGPRTGSRTSRSPESLYNWHVMNWRGLGGEGSIRRYKTDQRRYQAKNWRQEHFHFLVLTAIQVEK